MLARIDGRDFNNWNLAVPRHWSISRRLQWCKKLYALWNQDQDEDVAGFMNVGVDRNSIEADKSGVILGGRMVSNAGEAFE